MKYLILILALLSTQLFAGDLDQKRRWDRRNAPEQMGYDYIQNKYDYIVNFNELAVSGSLEQMPWSGDYWPTYMGGITKRWFDHGSSGVDKYGYPLLDDKTDFSQENLKLLSPAEKYDIFLGRYDFPLTQYERARTNIMKTIPESDEYDPDFDIPTWEGLCHAWAPATVLYDAPNPVEVEGANGVVVPFGASDVKALLTYFLHYDKGAKVNFLGGRCNLDFGKLRADLHAGKISQEEYDAYLDEGDCEDTNAGAFHIVLVNQIERKKVGFIADVTRDLEVWNQAVSAFEVEVLAERSGASEKAAPGTVREIEVQTRMYYTVEVSPSWAGGIPNHSLTYKDYRYVLELDKDDNIIGGEWVSFDRPDFLWKQSRPEFNGFFEPLEKIYNASVEVE